MKKSLLAAFVAIAAVAAIGFSAMAAKVILKEDFEGDLSKWKVQQGDGTVSADEGEAITSEALITDVISHSGSSSLNLFGPSRDGVTIYLPEMDLPTGYIEVWFYDPTGDRNAWVDQAYFIVEGDTQHIQMGQHGNPVTSEDQSRYAIYLNDTDGFIPSQITRSKGWHKFGFELLEDGFVNLYIDDKLQAETQHDGWTGIKKVGLLFYYSAKRADAIGVPIHEAYFDDLVIYDKKP